MTTSRNKKDIKKRETNKTRKNKTGEKMFIKSFINKMFTLQITLKMVHWTTRSYSIHKATDKSMEKIMPLIDSFVETFLGKYKYGKIKQDLIKSVQVKKINTSSDLHKFINDNVKYLTSLNSYNMNETNDDLMGIRDSILSELNVLRYLLHLEK